MVWGVLISLVLVGALMLLLMRIKQDATFSILSWIVAVLMVVVLSFEINRLISNLEDHSRVDDYIASIYDCIKVCLPDEIITHQLTTEEAYLTTVALKSALPDLSRYIRVSDLEGKTGEAISSSIREAITSSVHRYTWNLVGWIVLTIAIGTLLIVLTMGKGAGKSKRHLSSTPPSWKKDIDF